MSPRTGVQVTIWLPVGAVGRAIVVDDRADRGQGPVVARPRVVVSGEAPSHPLMQPTMERKGVHGHCTVCNVCAR